MLPQSRTRLQEPLFLAERCFSTELRQLAHRDDAAGAETIETIRIEAEKALKHWRPILACLFFGVGIGAGWDGCKAAQAR
jgi:hypothetical protein